MAKPAKPPDLDLLGGRIRAVREGLGLTQKDLGKLIDRDSQIISNWERGVHEPDDRNVLGEIARLGGVALAWLLVGEDANRATSQVDTSSGDKIPESYDKLIDSVVSEKGYPSEVGDRLRLMFQYTGEMNRFELEANAAIVARAAKVQDRAQAMDVEPRAGTMKL